jgi:cobalt-zinc-cadmium resistance protein CzcA
MEKIIAWSIKNRFLVVVFTFLTAGLGIVLLNRLPIDAVPDVTNVQVQIITDAPSLGPIEVEQFVTFPVESAMSGLPRWRIVIERKAVVQRPHCRKPVVQ